MIGPLQQELYYFSWFTATFCVCVANLFEMEYMFIHSSVGKEQGRKNVQFSKVVNISFFLYSVSFIWKEEPWFRVCLVKLE